MQTVKCLDTDTTYTFEASSGLEAIHKMLYTLNLSCKDDNAMILCHEYTWELQHNGKTYACLK